MLNSIFIFWILLISPSFAEDKIVNISQKIEFKNGDKIILKSTPFFVQIGFAQGSKCAIPNYNCGSGYIPPHFTFKSTCGDYKICPFVVISTKQNTNSGELTIEDEESCEKNNPKICFSEFARSNTSDEACMSLKSFVGRYYCLQNFTSSKRIENKDLCDKLPSNIYALKWNCYYEYAIRYQDVSFCDRYSTQEISGRDRCLLKMAELLGDQNLCKKISASKDHSYLEQCLLLKKPKNNSSL